jgi:hypothetical protein
MKRLATILALVIGVAGATAGTASAQDTVQAASIGETAAPVSQANALQFGGDYASNVNVSIAAAVNLASITQSLTQEAPAP